MNTVQKLKTLIDNKGVTYTFIASKTGISIDAISRVFRQKRKLPADELIAICNLLDIDINDLKEG